MLFQYDITLFLSLFFSSNKAIVPEQIAVENEVPLHPAYCLLPIEDVTDDEDGLVEISNLVLGIKEAIEEKVDIINIRISLTLPIYLSQPALPSVIRCFNFLICFKCNLQYQ